MSCCFHTPLVVALLLAAAAPADESNRMKLAREGKPAVALVEVKPGYGSAFCVHPSGLFVTNEQVVRQAGDGGAVTLVLDVGLKTQRVLQGKVVRADRDIGLALIRVEGQKNLPALPLGTADELSELMELVAFGFAVGIEFELEKGEYPALTVHVGNVTSLRRRAGELYHIHLDAGGNPGSSGGPVLDRAGKVVGVVGSSGREGQRGNFAIGVNQVSRFLARPDLAITAPELTRTNMHQPAPYQVRATFVLPVTGPTSLELHLRAGTEPERVHKMELADGVYRATVVAVPAPQGPATLRLRATFSGGVLTGSVVDQSFQIGGKECKLGDVSFLRLQPAGRAVLSDGRALEGVVSGLDDVAARVGPEAFRLNLGKALEAALEAPSPIDAVTYTIVASQDGKEVGRQTDRLPIKGVVPAHARAANASGIIAPELAEKSTVVSLPGQVEDVAVGGGGRYLILHLPSVRKLAIFDVNVARVVHTIALAETNLKFAAGRDKLIVVLPTSGLIQRWDLNTFERETTVMLPIKGVVKEVCMGSASDGPLVICGGSSQRIGIDDHQLHFLDIHKLKPIEVGWTNQRPHLGFDQAHVRASADGKVFGVSSNHGLISLTLVGNAIRAYHDHTAAYHSVPGPDGKVLYTAMGRYSSDLKALDGPLRDYRDQRWCLPAQQGNYYLAFRPHNPEARATVHMAGDGRTLAALPDLQIPIPAADRRQFSRDALTFDKRIQFLPAARLLITIPTGNDRLVLHRFDVEEALEQSGIDYLVVVSQPPLVARKGAAYTYQLVVKSKSAGLKYKVEAGPRGMAVSESGKVTWEVPADFAEAETDVILTVRNAAGQECFHTFKIGVRP